MAALFNKRSVNYSTKNIPIPNNDTYLKLLIDKTSNFIRRLRWRAFYFLKSQEDSFRNDSTDDSREEEPAKVDRPNFGFKSENSPPSIREISDFEKDMWNLVENIKFNKYRNEFQKQLIKDVKNIKNTKGIIMKSDKTRNYYDISTENYLKLKHNNITQHYHKHDVKIIDEINQEASEAVENLNDDLLKKVEILNNQEAYITIKDHKQNFQHEPKCRLINPTKSEIGIISHQILTRINNDIRNKINVNQWKNTNDVLCWFQGLENKQRLEFIQLDIVEFYPSISEKLFKQAIKFAKKYTDISKEESNILFNARKTVLIDGEEVWAKSNIDFDVSMGAYDGAEVAELVGLLILHKMNKSFPDINFGLYRDDGLGTYKNLNKQQITRMEKQIIKLFKDMELKITVNTRLQYVDFLDVSLDLDEDIYKPYRKPNDKPSYISTQSNHPPIILKQLPKMINDRLSKNSCNKHVFDKATGIYNEALRNSGYNTKLEFKKINKEDNGKKTRKRKRNIIWYNPPFNKGVDTNVGKEFLKIVDRHFGKQRKDKLDKIINRNTVKISYSCTANMENIISSHNKKILTRVNEEKKDNNTITTNKTCNCRNPTDCPLEGKCLTNSVVYKATIRTKNGEEKSYIGSTEKTFKVRFYAHKHDIKHNKPTTALAIYVSQCNQRNLEPNITWEILSKGIKRKSGNRKCDLCLNEKLLILKNVGPDSLNKRTELLAKCPHAAKFKLDRARKIT